MAGACCIVTFSKALTETQFNQNSKIATLNINSTGAKSMHTRGSSVTYTYNSVPWGGTMLCAYSGSHYLITSNGNTSYSDD